MSLVSIQLPTAWQTAPIHDVEHILSASYKGGPELHILGAILNDGTNVFVLAGEKGFRAARSGPANNWGIEEHYSGEPLVCGEMWTKVLNLMVEARDLADAEMGRPS